MRLARTVFFSSDGKFSRGTLDFYYWFAGMLEFRRVFVNSSRLEPTFCVLAGLPAISCLEIDSSSLFCKPEFVWLPKYDCNKSFILFWSEACLSIWFFYMEDTYLWLMLLSMQLIKWFWIWACKLYTEMFVPFWCQFSSSFVKNIVCWVWFWSIFLVKYWFSSILLKSIIVISLSYS